MYDSYIGLLPTAYCFLLKTLTANIRINGLKQTSVLVIGRRVCTPKMGVLRVQSWKPVADIKSVMLEGLEESEGWIAEVEQGYEFKGISKKTRTQLVDSDEHLQDSNRGYGR